MDKKVLMVVGRMHYGGLETMVMNFFRLMDREKVHIDFMINYEEKGVFDDEIAAGGGKMFLMPRLKLKNILRYPRAVKRFFGEHKGEYDIVHGHLTSVGIVYLLLARMYGVKTTIIHAHYTDTDKTVKGRFERLVLFPLRFCAKYYFACSNKAGRFCYGRRMLEKKNYHLVNNGIVVDSFVYQPAEREAKRVRMHLQDKFVLLHVGRFEQQKNHRFLLEVFRQVHAKEPSAVLLLAGDGSLKAEMTRLAEEYGISEAVWFLGMRKDVRELLQAADAFVLTSFYEGLPVVAVEAQAAGLHCVFADTITEETDITGNCRFLSLQESAGAWASEILKLKGVPRVNQRETIQSAGYDIEQEAQWLEEFYLTH